MNQNIYPIQLLNDIHNYFPDILYNPGRFRTVHDLLDYIRHVADVNPYSRGLNAYNNAYRERYSNTAPVQQRQPVRSGPSPSTPPLNLEEIMELLRNPNSTIPRTYTTTVDDIPITVRTTVVENDIPNLSTVRFMPTNALTSLLNIFGGGGGLPDILQPFLEQRVPIVASPNQINDATVVETARELQNEICTICQDQIESGNEMRKINHCGHYFHKSCIDTWFQSNVNCPTCRHDIREIEGNIPPPVPQNYRRTNIRQPDNP